MNTYSKLYLALLGQFPWKYLPAIPVEMVLLPNWSLFNIYKMSSWSRAMLIPLAIINHFKPTRELPARQTAARALSGRHRGKRLHPAARPAPPDLAEFFPARRPRPEISRARCIVARCAQRALEEAERWMVERIGEGSDGLAAVFPAMLNSIIALRALDYPKDHPLYQKALDGFRRSFCQRPGGFSDSALSFAGLGYGDQHHRAGRVRLPGAASRAAKSGAMAGRQGSAHPRRLDGEQSASGSERLGLRIQQRLLSGHGRHRDGADGVAAGSA